MEIRLTEQELASLFSTMLGIQLDPADVSISQEVGVVTLNNIPVEKILKLSNLTTSPSNPGFAVPIPPAYTFKYLDGEVRTTSATLEDYEGTDLLTMENLHAQSMELAEAGTRPLGPGETYDPPGAPTAEELSARRLRRG